MPRKKRKSELAALAQSRAANVRSAIVNPRLIPAKAKAVTRAILKQHTRAIDKHREFDKQRDTCACFPPNTSPICPTFGVGNSQYSIQPR